MIRKIASMSRAELAFRTRQEVQKRVDAIMFGFLRVNPFRNWISEQKIGSKAFFFRSQDIPQRVNLLRTRMPDQAELIVKRSEKICCHRFDLLGYEDLDYGQEIDWHSDRVHGKRAPRALFYKIPYLDFASVGDVKIIWELNRHQHLVTLAKAYR